jgi:hypothetical protein
MNLSFCRNSAAVRMIVLGLTHRGQTPVVPQAAISISDTLDHAFEFYSGSSNYVFKLSVYSGACGEVYKGDMAIYNTCVKFRYLRVLETNCSFTLATRSRTY